MDISILMAVLAAAILHATWNALIKSSGDRLISMALHDLVMSGICLCLIVFVAPFPAIASFNYILPSAGILIFYRIFLLKAYQYGDFGRSYPIARGIAPLLVACGGMILGDDILSITGYGAIGLISLGIISLTLSKKYSQGRKLDRGFFYALATGCVIATYSVVDSRGVRVSGTAIGYFAYLTAISCCWLPIFTILTKRKEVLRAIPTQGKRALISGSCSVIAYFCVIWAFMQTSAVQVVALRETSVIFGAIIGSYILKEGLGVRRITSAILVAAGVIILQIFG